MILVDIRPSPRYTPSFHFHVFFSFDSTLSGLGFRVHDVEAPSGEMETQMEGASMETGCI